MKNNYLFICDSEKTAWMGLSEKALPQGNTIHFTSETQANDDVLRLRYDLVIIDATVVKEPAQLVHELRAKFPGLRIIVAAVTPTWQEARAVLRAGAVDYFPRPANERDLLFMMQTTLMRLRSISD